MNIDRFNSNMLKSTVYVPLRRSGSRSTLNAFYINISFGPRVNRHVLQRHNIYKNLRVSLFESDIEYIVPFLAASSINEKPKM